MSLIQCPECKAQISDQAQTCPKCGFPNPSTPPTGRPAGVDEAITKTYLASGKIAAIKTCRELHPGMELKDAKEYVEKLESTNPTLANAAKNSKGCLSVVMVLITLAAAGMVCLAALIKAWA